MTTKEISDRILVRIDDSSSAPGSVLADANAALFPVPPEILSALNQAQEEFALLTLCLEATADMTLSGGTPFSLPRSSFSDFLCPLRLMVGGVRVRPSTLSDLDAWDDAWQNTPGTPSRYATLGFNFMAISPQPAIDTTASLTYARSPLQLVADAFPEIPEIYHQNLVEYGIYRVTLKQGAQGLERGMKYFNSFLDAATKCGDFVRAKSRAANYDVLPIELKLFDRARLVNLPKAK